jgi:Domain of unknown function (DUF4270)
VNLKKLLIGITICCTLVIFFAQCTKIKTTEIGTELIPVVDNVQTFDTSLTVVTNNFLFGDSALPLLGADINGNAPEHVLGYISNDPQFGRTNGSIYMELKPPFYKYYFENVKDSLFLDSVVLCMKWNSTWGDTNAVQKIDVFELDNELRSDSVYNTNVAFRYSNLLGTRSFPPNVLDDSLFLFRQNLANQLRIRLDDSFGKKLLSQDSATGEPFSSDSAFRQFFKGFAIVPDANISGSNALMGFSISDTNTYLRLYYRYIKNGVVDTTNRSFVFINNYPSGNANSIKRNYSGSQLQNHLVTNPSGDSLVYVQAAPGTYSIIRLPSIEGFKALKGNVIVHLAELNMIQIPGPANEFDNYLTAPEVIYMDFLDTIQNIQFPFLTDALLSGRYEPRVFGGIGRSVVGLNGQVVTSYNLFITRYIQNIITRNTPNFPLYLYAPYTVSYPNLRLSFGVNRLSQGRVKLGGGTHSSQKMKLRIIYSKI